MDTDNYLVFDLCEAVCLCGLPVFSDLLDIRIPAT